VKCRREFCAASLILLLINADRSFAQAPRSPDRPWHSPVEQQIARDVQLFRDARLHIDPVRVYSLGELIDFAEAHNPLTRVAWENACAQAAAFGVARSELYPTVVAVAFSGITRDAEALENSFFLQTLPAFTATLDVQYTVLTSGPERVGSLRQARKHWQRISCSRHSSKSDRSG